jgi:heptosyltransferase-2
MRILLVQTSFLGDVVLSTPVISALREKFPTAELWMMTTPIARGLVERDPELAGVITFDKNRSERSLASLWSKARELRAMRFDQAFALQRSARTSLLLFLAGIPTRIGFASARLSWLYHERRTRDNSCHDVIRNLQILGDSVPDLQSRSHSLRVFTPQWGEISDSIRSKLVGTNNPIVMVPGSVWKTKRWDWRGYREVAKRFIRQGRTVILVGAPDERELAEKVAGNLPVLNMTGQTSIAELAWVISRAALVVCNDSMALHLSSAAKIPTVAIFCATSPTFGFGPWENLARVIEVEALSCKPCSRHGGDSCPTGTWACMRELSPNQVFEAGMGLLRERATAAQE